MIRKRVPSVTHVIIFGYRRSVCLELMKNCSVMKGLYCRAVSDADPKFVIQETTLPDVLSSHQVRVQVKACGLSPLDFKLLRDMGMQTDFIPVGREVAGVVLQVGPKVTFFQPENEVVGILPLDSPCSGLCEVIDMDEHYLVQKPEKLSSACVAGALRDGLCAYTALHTHARMAAGHTLLVMDGASSFGLMCIQLACYHGVKVLTTSHSPQKHAFLEQLRPSVGVQDPLVELFRFITTPQTCCRQLWRRREDWEWMWSLTLEFVCMTGRRRKGTQRRRNYLHTNMTSSVCWEWAGTGSHPTKTCSWILQTADYFI
ncbi:quinone oxidoreductase-like protein 1 isoform X3 [Archocentrus centrarchus]|uniref:quinone oxidoreductase-like protein 1 isoform X3 n=1 Tax=Archocentrus centrarchus TaxID=63155 RepID=UPI0011EA1C06|nr:quinone oxidoreductase-like protein 1 isoform X3 [Archocentrus centrarchus]